LLDIVPAGHEVVTRVDAVELAVYVEPAAVERVRTAFPDARVSAVAPGWEERWKRFHRPVTLAGLWIGPPWEHPPAGVPTVVIDPGRAFGTGAHPTTRLCVEQLTRIEPGPLLDLGCGSGVLSVAAAKLGFAPVVALDADPAAVDATERNAEANGVAVTARLADVTSDRLPAAHTAVANIALPIVNALADRIECAVLVTSGYYEDEAPSAARFRLVERRTTDGWAADRFVRATKYISPSGRGHVLRPLPRLQGFPHGCGSDP
jgi:ribosomal protein L11 methyltransferase